MKNPFKFSYKKITSTSYIYLINIEKIDDNLKKYIDSKITSICTPNENFDLPTTKKMLLQFLENKNNKQGKASTLTMGYIAEFFHHLFLSANNFKQEFQFLNLEENSMKKGFDGVYTFENKNWILESKSTGKTDNTHKKNFKVAYKDLSDKVSGKVNNNPWFNALNHVKVIGTKNQSLITKIRNLSAEYTNKQFYLIDNFNIIPCSTMILENDWKEIDVENTINEFEKELSNVKYKNIIIVCLNKKSLSHFRKYLES